MEPNMALGGVAAIVVGAAALVGEAVSVDPAVAVGTGGVGVGAWLASTAWNAYKKWSKTLDLQQRVLRAQLESLQKSSMHQEREEEHWQREERYLDRQGQDIADIRRELRTGPPTGPHTPIAGIPITDR